MKNKTVNKTQLLKVDSIMILVLIQVRLSDTTTKVIGRKIFIMEMVYYFTVEAITIKENLSMGSEKEKVRR